jgi:hypothetical protein
MRRRNPDGFSPGREPEVGGEVTAGGEAAGLADERYAPENSTHLRCEILYRSGGESLGG